MDVFSVAGLIGAISSGYAVLRGAIPILYRAAGYGETGNAAVRNALRQQRESAPVFGRLRLFSTTPDTSSGSPSDIYASNQSALAHAILLTGGWIILAWFLLCLAEIVISVSQRRRSSTSPSDPAADKQHRELAASAAPKSYQNTVQAGYMAYGINFTPASINNATAVTQSGIQLVAIGSIVQQFLTDLAVAARDTFSSSIKAAWSFKGIFLSGALIFIGTQFFLIKTELAVTLYATLISQPLSVIFDRFLSVIAVLLIVLPWIVFIPFVILIYGIMKVFTVKNGVKIVLRSSAPQLASVAFNLIKVLMAIVAALYLWASVDPLGSMIALDTPFALLLSTVQEVWDTIVAPSCVLLKWPLDGIFQTINHPSLVSILTLIVNSPGMLARVFFFRPVVTGELPQIYEVDDYQTTILTAAGDFLQNATVNTGNVFIGDLKDYYPINATTPALRTAGTDDPFQYVVRAFGAKIFLGAATLISALVGLVLTVLEIALKPLEWFRPGGYTFFTFEYVRDKAHLAGQYFGTIIDIAPACQIPGAEYYVDAVPIQYSGIFVGLWSAIIALVFIIKDTVIGEIYTFVDNFELLYFTAGYFYANSRELIEFDAAIYKLARSTGCAFGNLSEGLGITLDGIIRTLFNSFPMLLLKLVFYVRLAFTQQTADILEDLDAAIDKLEADLLELPKLSWFIYRFANRNSLECATEIDIVCGFGATFENVILLAVQVVVIAIRAIVNTVRRIVNLFVGKNFGDVPGLSFAPLVYTGYRAGAAAGIFLGSFVQIDLQCHKTQPNICAVRFFEQLGDFQTPSVCFATFLSLIGGGFLGGVTALVGIAFEFLVNLDFLKGDSTSAVLESSNKLLLSIFERFLKLFNVFFMGPFCPAGHFLDCPISLFIPGANICSKFLCYVNDATVTITTQLGEIVIQAVNLAFGIAKILFTGDFSTATIRGVLDAAWSLFSAVITQVFFFGLRTVFGPLLTVIRNICNILSIKSCVDFLDTILGTNQPAGFGATNTKNYLDRNIYRKKRAGFQSFVPDMTDEMMRNKIMFEVYKSMGYIYPHEYNETTDTTIWRQRDVSMEDFISHMAQHTSWDEGSSCYALIHAYRNSTIEDIEIGSLVMIRECIDDKMTMVATSAGIPILSWLPDSLIYNVKRRAPTVIGEVGVSLAVLLQFEMDRRMPHERVMSAEYRDFFKGIGLNVTHLDTTFREYYPEKTPGKVAVNASYLDLVEFEHYRETNMTAYSYWYNNFYYTRFANESDFANRVKQNNLNSTLVERVAGGLSSLDEFYTSALNVALEGIDVQRRHVEFITQLEQVKQHATNVDPVNQLPLDDPCIHMPYALCVVNGTTNTRYEIFKRYGPEKLNSYDRRRMSEGAFFSVAKAMDAIFGLSSKLGYVFTGETYYHDELDNANYLDPSLITIYNKEYVSSTHIDVPLHDPRYDFAFKEAGKKRTARPEGGLRNYDTREEWYASLSDDEKVNHLLNIKKQIREEKRAESRERMNYMRAAAANSTDAMPTWTDVFGAIRRGTAKRIEKFLVDNDAVWPDHAVVADRKGKRFLQDLEAGDETKRKLQERSPLSVIVIASVAAFADRVELNTTKVPIWCNSTAELRKACSLGDWRNAAEYLKNDPELYANFQGFFNHTVSSFWDTLKPRTPEAQLFRHTGWKIAEGLSGFAWDIVARSRGYYENEKIGDIATEALHRVQEVEKDAEFEKYKTEKEKEQDQVTSFKRSIENDPTFKHLFSQTRKYVPVSEQRRRDQLWFRERFGRYFDGQHSSLVQDSEDMTEAQKHSDRVEKNLVDLEQITFGSDPIGVLEYHSERSLVDDPATMTMARPLTGDHAKTFRAATVERSLFAASSRAFYSWIEEEQKILDDYDRLRSLFLTVDQSERQQKEAAKLEKLAKQLRMATYDTDSETADTKETDRLLEEIMRDRAAAKREADMLGDEDDGSGITSDLAVKLGSIVIKSRYFRCKLYNMNAERMRLTYNDTSIPGCEDPYHPLANVPDGVKAEVSEKAVVEETWEPVGADENVESLRVASVFETHHVKPVFADSNRPIKRIKLMARIMPSLVTMFSKPENTMAYWRERKNQTVEEQAAMRRKRNVQLEGGSEIRYVKNLVQLSFSFEKKDPSTRMAESLSESMRAYQTSEPKPDLFTRTEERRVSSHFFYEADDIINDANSTFSDILDRAGQLGFPITLVCPFPGSFICDAKFGCRAVGEAALQVKRLFLLFIHLFGNWVPLQNARTLMYLPYAWSTTASAKIGFGDYPPYSYARGISQWYLYRGLPGEIAGAQNGTDGPKWRTLLLDITGGVDFPSVYTNGTLYSEFRLYKEYRSNNTLESDPRYADVVRNKDGWNIIYFIQETLGVQLLEFVDTLLSWSFVVAPSAISWAFSLFSCKYWEQLTCRKRLYSLAGAIALIWEPFQWPIIVSIVIGSPMTAFSIFLLFGSVASVAVPVLAWGWSPICSLPPICSVPEIFELAVYTIRPRADLFEGNFITNSNYSNANCFLYEGGLSRLVYPDIHPTGIPQRNYVNCRDMGFENEYDGYEAFEIRAQSRIFDPLASKWTDGTANYKALPLWLRVLRGTTDTTYTIIKLAGLESYFPRPTLTRDWKGEFSGAGENIYADYYAVSDVHYRNQNQCADISVYRSIGLLMLKVSGVLILSASLAGILFVIFKALVLLGIASAVFLFSAWTTLPIYNSQVSGNNFYRSFFDGDNINRTPYAALWDSEAEANLAADLKMRGLI